MFAWFTAIRETWRDLRRPNPVTEEMVYTVIPTTWIRTMKVKERLLNHYPELRDLEVSDAQIYSCLKRLEVRGQIECDMRRYPHMHYDVGICRKTGPGRPSHRIELSPTPDYA